MKFIVSKQVQQSLEKDFPEEYFLDRVESFLNLNKAKIMNISYLIVEDLLLENLEVLNSIQNKNPHLKIIFYYDPNFINLDRVLNLPVSLPFAKGDGFTKFLDFLIILKKRNQANPIKKNFFQSGFFLDVEQKLLTKDFKQVRLSETEFKLLQSLMLRKGRVVSKETLLDEVWNYHLFSNTKTLEVHISRLRKILKKNFNISPIQTIYKTGYMFDI
tara:strand:+ start:201 stop:848 length:648 start_codon:yes stop_codon:yes gene_type:complete